MFYVLLAIRQPGRQHIYRFSLQPSLPPLRQYLPSSIGLVCLYQSIDVTQPILALIRIGFERRLEVKQTGSWLLYLHRQQSQIVVCIRVIRLSLQNSSVKTFGVLQLTRLVVSNSLLKYLFHA